MSQRPKLLVVTQTHNLRGGIESWMADVFPHLESVGWDVSYGLAKGCRFNQPIRFVKEHAYITKAHLLDASVGTASSRQGAIQKLISRLRPDIVLPLAVGDVAPALRLARREGAPSRLLVALHSLHVGTLADIVQNDDIVDMCGVVSGLLWRWAQSAVESPAQRVRWIRNGVPQATVAAKQNRGHSLRVGYVGRLDQDIKRAHDIPSIVLEVCRHGGSISLDIVGEGAARNQIEERLRSIGPSVAWRAHGWKDRQYIYEQILPQLDCIILPSVTEGNPLAVIEAMQFGVVPVVSEFHGLAGEGMLRPEQNCLTFPVGDVGAAATQIRRLAGDQSLVHGLSSAAKIAATRYTRQRMLDGWEAALSDLLSRHPRQPLPSVKVGLAAAQSGRLEQLGVPSRLADRLRRIRTSKFRHPSGFDEWPGSLCQNTGLMDTVAAALSEVEAECWRTLRQSVRRTGAIMDSTQT